MKFIECPSCEEEFRVVSDSLTPVSYCPFCAEVIPVEIEDDEYSAFDDEDDNDY